MSDMTSEPLADESALTRTKIRGYLVSQFKASGRCCDDAFLNMKVIFGRVCLTKLI